MCRRNHSYVFIMNNSVIISPYFGCFTGCILNLTNCKCSWRRDLLNKGAVTCAVCPESAWLVTFLIGNVSTGVVTWSALRCGASGESGKKVAAAPLSKTAAAAAAAETWFAKLPLDYMLHNRFPWKRSGRRSSMWPPYSLRRNLSAAACRPCDRSLKQIFSKMIMTEHLVMQHT